MHPDQVALDPDVAARLVREQFPRWSGDTIVPLATTATTSYIYRIGEHHAARFPMTGQDATALRARILAEGEAMAEFASASTVPAPVLVAVGEPADGYPLPWSVQTWVDGEPATPDSAAGSVPLARDLVRLIQALRAVDTRGRRFSGGGRGGDLTAHDEWAELCLVRSAGLLPVDRLRAAWHALRELPRSGPDVMSHKDLISSNILIAGDRLCGVLDTGGFGPADPALDLVVAWHALDAEARSVLREGLGCDDLEWRRGAAWALVQALGLVWYYVDSNPGMAELGRSTIERLLGAPELGV